MRCKEVSDRLSVSERDIVSSRSNSERIELMETKHEHTTSYTRR